MKAHVLAAAAIAGLAAPLAAQPAGGPPPLPSTRAEMQQMGAQRFAMRDADHDGFLTAAELGEHATMALGALDVDHDGKVSAAEANAGMTAMFDQADQNHDGTISDEERAAVRMAPPPGPAPRPAPSGN